MKNRKIYSVLLLVMILGFTSCSQWTAIDEDPDSINDGPAITENIELIGVESEWMATATSRWNPNGGGIPDWLSWESIEGSTPTSMNIGNGFGNEIWNSYAGSLKHAVELYDKAQENGNSYYQGIAGVIAAWHWFYIADVYDKAPLEDAFMGLENLQPSLNSQEELYAHANGLLDEAINLFNAPSTGQRLPASDDYVYNGDITKWGKLAYSIKARQAMRLSYAPEKTKTAQADLVLSYLENGMKSNDDICSWKHLDELANASPIYRYMNEAYSGGRGLTPGNFLVDMMNGYTDPRRYIMFTFSEEDPDGFVGHRDGQVVAPGKIPSHYKYSYFSKDYPDFIMTYAETLFLKAEAYVFKAQFDLAEEAMKAGTRADMEYMDVPEEDIAAYLDQESLDMPTTEEAAQELVIKQKYLANVYRTMESYYDYIRTGYPDFDFDYMIENVYNVNTFPRRFPYPADEIEKNPNVAEIGQKDWFKKGTTWDNKN